LSDLKFVNLLIAIALRMFYEEERFPNMSFEERNHLNSAEQWMVCFNQERIRKAEEFLESPQQTSAAWNPAWKRNKKKKNKRKHH
jgi:hypothetical protein